MNRNKTLRYTLATTIFAVSFVSSYSVLNNFGSISALAGASHDSRIKVDGVSGATIPRKKGSKSLTGDALQSLLEFGGAAYLLSTVNEDGSPYVAPIAPQIEADGKVKFVSGLTRTRKNIDRDGNAVLTAYAISCGGDDVGMHMGARLVLRVVGGKIGKAEAESYGLRTVILQIEEILPLEEKIVSKPKSPYRR